MSKYTLSGRTIYIDDKPMFELSRNGNDSEGYNMRPCDLDTMAHVIVNLLNAANVLGTWSVRSYDGDKPIVSETDKARDIRYKVSARHHCDRDDWDPMDECPECQ